MNRNIGQEIPDGLGEIQQWKAGEKKLKSTELHLPKAADVVEIRNKRGLSQSQFAALLGISVGTLRNWEHGRREPHGPARARLRVAQVEPDALGHAIVGE